MCAVIGMVFKNPTKETWDKAREVFRESGIRGLHATGFSFLPKWSRKVETIRESINADEFIHKHMHMDNFDHVRNRDGNLYLIGHCRYSTSDLEYNQPLANENKSIVHNGVITQLEPEEWRDIWGYECDTRNDSELVLHSQNALQEYEDSSIAAVELHRDKKMVFYRNGKRPLYVTRGEDFICVTSTKDIAKRANLNGVTSEVQPFARYVVDENLNLMYNKLPEPEKFKDLQHV